MRVFLSWSGEPSRRVALALRDWLPSVIQSLEPWLSSEDVSAGARWVTEISDALESSKVGIVCLTPDNIHSTWLNFEAGALSRNVDTSLVCLYAVGIAPSELVGPLAQFQCTRADRDDTLRLLLALNQASEHRLRGERLSQTFDHWWPHLERVLADITTAESQAGERAPSTVEEKLDQILGHLSALRVHGGANATTSTPNIRSAAGERSERRPRVFIGSSTEGLEIAEAIQLGLENVAECTIWNQAAFGLSDTVIESIVDATAQYDFAVLVLTADDMSVKRGAVRAAPRDNILFELGLFTGALTRARTFMVYCQDEKLQLPSDVGGVTAATFRLRADGNLQAALGPVCTRIKRAMGLRGSA